MYGIFNISLPIYAGGKIRYGIESAKYLQQAVMLDAENDKEAVILNTINAYINLYKAAVTVNVVKENLQQSLAAGFCFITAWSKTVYLPEMIY